MAGWSPWTVYRGRWSGLSIHTYYIYVCRLGVHRYNIYIYYVFAWLYKITYRIIIWWISAKSLKWLCHFHREDHDLPAVGARFSDIRSATSAFCKVMRAMPSLANGQGVQAGLRWPTWQTQLEKNQRQPAKKMPKSVCRMWKRWYLPNLSRFPAFWHLFGGDYKLLSGSYWVFYMCHGQSLDSINH